MEAVIYYAQTEGFTLERIVRTGSFDMRAKHFHHQYEIFYILEGERQFFFNQRLCTASAGSLILIDENVIHMTRSPSNNSGGHDRIILYIDRNKMQALENKFPQLRLIEFFHANYGVFHLSPEQQERFIRFYLRLVDEFDHKAPHYKIQIELELVQYFIDFMRDTCLTENAALPTGLSAREEQVYAVAAYLASHCTEKPRLDELASRFFLSKYYLCRSFREITGYTIHEFMHLHRIQAAVRQLEESELSIAALAKSLGYDSVSYFEKIFKEYMNCSPLQYRKSSSGPGDVRRLCAQPHA